MTTPQPAAQHITHTDTALRFARFECASIIENMSGFVTPNGDRFTIFGEGGGQVLADELDVPLLGKISSRKSTDEGMPLVLEDPDAPAAQALFHIARGRRRRHAAGAAAVFQAPSGTSPQLRPTLDGALAEASGLFVVVDVDLDVVLHSSGGSSSAKQPVPTGQPRRRRRSRCTPGAM